MFNKKEKKEVVNQKMIDIQNIQIVTTHTLPGKEIKEVFGLVKILHKIR